MGAGLEFCGYGDVLMIATGLKGHIDPMICVAKGLSNYGITSTIVIQEDLRALIDADIENQVDGLIIQLVPATFIRFPVWQSLNTQKACEYYCNQMLEDRKSGAPIPKCIIADMFQAWTQNCCRVEDLLGPLPKRHLVTRSLNEALVAFFAYQKDPKLSLMLELADKLEMPRYVSCPSPATFGLVMKNFSALVAKGLLKGRDPNPLLQCPGTPNLRLSHLPPVAAKVPSFLSEKGDTFKKSAGILVNTLYDLEPRAIDTFQAELEATSKREAVTKIYPIGPMLPSEFFSPETCGSSEGDSETVQWLNTRAERSVLYVAFGSMAYLEPLQIVELAYGLESSQVSFLWILRVQKPKDGEPAANVNDLLPSGFRERTKDRGLVYTEFAPQLQILSHPATGGFLTHCGWNSCLESICRGVPMLAWPMHAEQGLNCRIVVDEAKVALEIEEGPGGAVEREGVHKGIKQLMIETPGNQLKERVWDLRKKARVAISPGGSSHGSFESLVKQIHASPRMPLQTL